MEDELKTLIEEQGKTFEAFKASNDQLQKEIKTLRADAVTVDRVERLNAQLDELGQKIAAADKKSADRADLIETKVNRSTLSAKADDRETKAAADFSAIVGASYSAEEMRDYKSAIFSPGGYLRRGASLPSGLVKAMSVGSDADGGYLVPPDTTGRIMTRVYETTPMRQYATVVSIGTDRLEGLNDLGESGSGWVGETAARPETTTPQLGKYEIPVHELYAEPRISQKMIDDSIVDIESWLANKVSDKFAREENAAFVSGSGVQQPRGAWTYPTVATADANRSWGSFQHVNTGLSAGFASSAPADILLDVIYALKVAYRANARWMMSRATLGAVRKIKDGTGQYIWAPGLVAGSPSSLLGFPVAEGENVPAIAANSLAMAFGDFAAAYTIVDRAGIRILRDPYITKPWIKFYTTKRTGGGAVDFDALKFVRFGT